MLQTKSVATAVRSPINMVWNSVLIIAITLAVTVSSKIITSPDVCLSDLDCPDAIVLDTFCNRTAFTEIPSCVPRLPLDAVCNDAGPRECQQGLTCTFKDSTSADKTCQLPPFRGEKCSPLDSVPCIDDLVCDRNNKTCRSFTDGFAGTPCDFDRDCQQDKGFYCQTEPGLCAPKRGPGGECNRPFDSFVCLGFCAYPTFGEGGCVRGRKEGELCTDDRQCDNAFFNPREQLEDPMVCNVPTGQIGRCLRTSRLINRLGAKCDPNHDRCDARRSLTCKPTRKGENVCQHRASRSDRERAPFCDPKSPFSRCTWGDERRECRLERNVPGAIESDGQSPFFACLRKSEKVHRGGLCITEYAACADGTECRVIPGVTSGFDKFSREPIQRVAYCVQTARKDESCGDVNDKFTTQCAQGLRCEKGRCMQIENTEPPSDEAETHAGLSAVCSNLPCAPGLVCEKEYESDTQKKCRLPLRIVGKGRACSDRATERRGCEEGLVCALRKDGTNIKRCREPRKVGDFCQEAYQCSDGLACLSGELCYDPKNTLNLGDPCNPETSASEAGCVVNERPTEFDPNEKFLDPMRCISKGDGFACRVVMGLFEGCDEEKDILCDIGLTCNNIGICVPGEEA